MACDFLPSAPKKPSPKAILPKKITIPNKKPSKK